MLTNFAKPDPDPGAFAPSLANPDEAPPEANGLLAGVEEVCGVGVPHGDALPGPAGVPNAGCVEPVAAPVGFDACPNVEPAAWPNGLADPTAEGAPNAGCLEV